jgi:hypothetical protein
VTVLIGEKNGRWKGGRTRSKGYVVVLVGANRYVSEHRRTAEKLLGRPLHANEQVHHRNGNRADNRPENLAVLDKRVHAELHSARRRQRHDLRLPGEANFEITCACGCGQRLLRFDGEGRPRSFLSEHRARLKLTIKQVAQMREAHARGQSVRTLASEFGVSESHASRVIRGLKWRL